MLLGLCIPDITIVSDTSNGLQNAIGHYLVRPYTVDGQNLAPLSHVNSQQTPHPLLNIGKKPWQGARVQMAANLHHPDAHGCQY